MARRGEHAEPQPSARRVRRRDDRAAVDDRRGNLRCVDTTLAMARDGHLPRRLAAVPPRFRTPHRAELAVGAVVAVLAATVDLRGAIGFSSFAVLVYYAIANAAAITLGHKVVPAIGLGAACCWQCCCRRRRCWSVPASCLRVPRPTGCVGCGKTRPAPGGG